MARFIDTKKLGSGGFGEVWLCTRKEDGGVFAKKKLLHGVDDDGIARFQREVRLLSRLDHPNIVKVVGFHLQKPPYWYVMPRYGHTHFREIPSLTGDTTRIITIFTAVLSAMDWKVDCSVLVRDGDFPYDETTSDYRPIVVEINWVNANFKCDRF